MRNSIDEPFSVVMIAAELLVKQKIPRCQLVCMVDVKWTARNASKPATAAENKLIRISGPFSCVDHSLLPVDSCYDKLNAKKWLPGLLLRGDPFSIFLSSLELQLVAE
uniref:(northern house mosquito) hypothetical protein n=1 Tax=Culex pipiens TaxID=7175 RepID=A0A8D8C0B1_CULPI